MVGKLATDARGHPIDPSALAERLDALPGIDELRDAAAGRRRLPGRRRRPRPPAGRGAHDLDVVVEGEIGSIAEALGGELVEHERFDTANVVLGELEVDIARTRAETYARPGALPEVAPATIAEDLARRDFTVNAMAVPAGRGGGADRPARGPGRPPGRASCASCTRGSFVDDPTRALRAARYAARLGFDLEPETERQLRAADLSTVSEDRIIGELGKIAVEERPSAALALIADWGLLDLGTAPKLAAALERLFDSEEAWAGFADRGTAILLAIAPAERARELRGRAARLSHHSPPGSPAEIHVLAHDHSAAVLAIARAAGARLARRLRVTPAPCGPRDHGLRPDRGRHPGGPRDRPRR